MQEKIQRVKLDRKAQREKELAEVKVNLSPSLDAHRFTFYLRNKKPKGWRQKSGKRKKKSKICLMNAICVVTGERQRLKMLTLQKRISCKRNAINSKLVFRKKIREPLENVFSFFLFSWLRVTPSRILWWLFQTMFCRNLFYGFRPLCNHRKFFLNKTQIIGIGNRVTGISFFSNYKGPTKSLLYNFFFGFSIQDGIKRTKPFFCSLSRLFSVLPVLVNFLHVFGCISLPGRTPH